MCECGTHEKRDEHQSLRREYVGSAIDDGCLNAQHRPDPREDRHQRPAFGPPDRRFEHTAAAEGVGEMSDDQGAEHGLHREPPEDHTERNAVVTALRTEADVAAQCQESQAPAERGR